MSPVRCDVCHRERRYIAETSEQAATRDGWYVADHLTLCSEHADLWVERADSSGAHATGRTNSDAYWARIADWAREYRPEWRCGHRYRDTSWGVLHELALTRDAEIIDRVIAIKRRRLRAAPVALGGAA